MAKLTYGIGYNSTGAHKTSINNKNTKAYATWKGMLRRCYDTKTQLKYPTYKDCTVAEEWHDFQNFADWFYNQDYSDLGYHLDKDILYPANKVYSSETCALIPSQLNTVLSSCKACRGDLPQGVSYHKMLGKYRVRINIKGKEKHLGVFDCMQEAYKAYKQAKEANVKRMALEWQDRIADNAFQALMNWQLAD